MTQKPASIAGEDEAPAFFPMLVIFDLDGTLADGKHREHYVTRPVGEKDWRAYFAACDRDQPVRAIVQTLRAFVTAGHDVQIWTGRSDEVAEKTAFWLDRHGLAGIPMRSRARGDHTADDVLKAQWLAECSRKPNLVFEERARVVAMWRAEGIPCFQVAPGDF